MTSVFLELFALQAWSYDISISLSPHTTVVAPSTHSLLMFFLTLMTPLYYDCHNTEGYVSKVICNLLVIYRLLCNIIFKSIQIVLN